MGLHCTFPSGSLVTIPGRTSISSPTFSTPCMMDPPATPPSRFSTSWPGLFTSKDRITIRRGALVKSRTGTGMLRAMNSQATSMLYRSTAEIGITGALSATVPATNFLICSCCTIACSGFTRSTLFCKMMTWLRRMISTAARCSLVCGCGHGSFPAMSSRAASMTAAPLSMVAMRMSCPGQSTKDTWRTRRQVRPPSSNTSAVLEPLDLYRPICGASPSSSLSAW
mmetsp:Transcript_13770/g.20281  ORF Transcript_13770/g.20281 Transcript_13770/m.20281 type:complete len:225 (-) Transcript_13770:578-1252(-)